MQIVSPIAKITSDSANLIVERIKNGDRQLKEKFIEDYIPFIIRVISSFYSEKIVDVKNSDEYSIGLMAFDEAIEKYDSKKNIRFLNFAQLVIKRRMIDYFRNISLKNKYEIPFSYFNSKYENELEKKFKVPEIATGSGIQEIIKELNDFSKELKKFGLDLKNLHDYIPKHKDSKQMCFCIAKKIIENKDIYDKIMYKKYFPMKELSKIIDVHPKTVERNREFIVCICIVYTKNFEYFKEYLSQVF